MPDLDTADGWWAENMPAVQGNTIEIDSGEDGGCKWKVTHPFLKRSTQNLPYHQRHNIFLIFHNIITLPLVGNRRLMLSIRRSHGCGIPSLLWRLTRCKYSQLRSRIKTHTELQVIEHPSLLHRFGSSRIRMRSIPICRSKNSQIILRAQIPSLQA